MKEPHTDTSYVNAARVLRINVGFLLAEGAGYSRLTSLDVPQRLRITDDLIVQFLQGDLRLTRTTEGILVQGFLQTALQDTCSRCLTELEVPLDVDLEELFATPPHLPTQFMVGDDNFIDLAPLIREEAIIAMPHKLYCRPDCKGLCPNCGANWNETTCGCEAQNVDPRWAALVKFQDRLPDENQSER